jgi:hypothetical protein
MLHPLQRLSEGTRHTIGQFWKVCGECSTYTRNGILLYFVWHVATSLPGNEIVDGVSKGPLCSEM